MGSFGDLSFSIPRALRPAVKEAVVAADVEFKALPVEEQARRIEAFNASREGSFFGMSTPQWIKDIGDKIRPIAQVVGAVAIGGVIGRIIGGTRESPTVAAGDASVAAQQALPGVPDVGKVSTGAAQFMGMKLTKQSMLLMAAVGIGLTLLFLKGR